MNPDDRLQRDLEQLGGTAIFAPTPDFAGRIADALPPRANRPSPERYGVRPAFPRHSVTFAVLTVLVLLALLATLAISPARESVARWLHIDLPGIRIEHVVDDGDTERSLPTSLGGVLLLGTPVSLESANGLPGSPLLGPSTALVGEPMEIWQRNNGEVVTMLYAPSPTLPEIGETGVGLLVTRIRPADDAMLYVKKSFGNGVVERVLIDGREGWWIVNGKLTVLAEEPSATDSRTSGNVLIWSDSDGVTWRMESVLPRDEAIRIASSMTPIAHATGNRGSLAVVWVSEGFALAPEIALFASIALEVPHAPNHAARSGRHDVSHRSRPGGCGWLGPRGAGDTSRGRRRGGID